MGRTEFDIAFENAFIGNKQMYIIHKYRMGGDIYHICTVDGNNVYSEGWYDFNPTDYTFVKRDDG